MAFLESGFSKFLFFGFLILVIVVLVVNVIVFAQSQASLDPGNVRGYLSFTGTGASTYPVNGNTYTLTLISLDKAGFEFNAGDSIDLTYISSSGSPVDDGVVIKANVSSVISNSIYTISVISVSPPAGGTYADVSTLSSGTYKGYYSIVYNTKDTLGISGFNTAYILCALGILTAIAYGAFVARAIYVNSYTGKKNAEINAIKKITKEEASKAEVMKITKFKEAYEKALKDGDMSHQSLTTLLNDEIYDLSAAQKKNLVKMLGFGYEFASDDISIKVLPRSEAIKGIYEEGFLNKYGSKTKKSIIEFWNWMKENVGSDDSPQKVKAKAEEGAAIIKNLTGESVPTEIKNGFVQRFSGLSQNISGKISSFFDKFFGNRAMGQSVENAINNAEDETGKVSPEVRQIAREAADRKINSPEELKRLVEQQVFLDKVYYNTRPGQQYSEDWEKGIPIRKFLNENPNFNEEINEIVNTAENAAESAVVCAKNFKNEITINYADKAVKKFKESAQAGETAKDDFAKIEQNLNSKNYDEAIVNKDRSVLQGIKAKQNRDETRKYRNLACETETIINELLEEELPLSGIKIEREKNQKANLNIQKQVFDKIDECSKINDTDTKNECIYQGLINSNITNLSENIKENIDRECTGKDKNYFNCVVGKTKKNLGINVSSFVDARRLATGI